MASRERVLLLAATTAYQTGDFQAAAARLGVQVVLGCDRCGFVARHWPDDAIAVDFRRPALAATKLAEAVGRVDGVVVTDERTAVIGALVAELLGVPYNLPDAARATFDKLLMRQKLAAADVPQPWFRAVSVTTSPDQLAGELEFPVVIKPRHLSTSRGVMRANDPGELRQRWTRLVELLADPDVVARSRVAAAELLVERFVPGHEVAYEGLLRGGQLQTLAVFDKPDPLDGPFFAETIYVTPAACETAPIAKVVAASAEAIGLREGPVHAELRLSPTGPVVIEIAARSIGGLCGRSLRFGAGISLEELVVAHAVGRQLPPVQRVAEASGVLMLPAPVSGVLRGIAGTEAASAVPHIHEVTITARVGDPIVALPEGHAYLGFVFAAAPDPDTVVAALRAADEQLHFEISRLL